MDSTHFLVQNLKIPLFSLSQHHQMVNTVNFIAETILRKLVYLSHLDKVG